MTDKQKRFCEEYLIDSNATKAAIRAGYSKKTAKEIGCENLTKPNIKEYIERKQQETSTELQITFESQLLDLEWVKGTAKEKQSLSDYVNAVKEQNKMLGHYAPDRVDHTTKGESLNKTIELPDGENWNDLKNQIRQIDNE